MQVLEIEDTTRIPLMKTVKRQFLKLAKAKHPDGGLGTDADFVELLEAKEFLLNHIKHNKPNEDDQDLEEKLARKEYDLATIEKLNKDSVTIFIPTHHVQAWRVVLEENFGKPITLPVKLTPAPVQYKSMDGVAITSWYKEKVIRSTILIQGRASYLKFAKVEFPKLFEQVIAKLP